MSTDADEVIGETVRCTSDPHKFPLCTFQYGGGGQPMQVFIPGGGNDALRQSLCRIRTICRQLIV
jgi:hypothetical protein